MSWMAHGATRNTPSPKSRRRLSDYVFGLVGCFSSVAVKHKECQNLPIEEIPEIPGYGKSAQLPLSSNELSAVQLSVSDLMKATNNFAASLQIGQGGFGTVYKGKLKDGSVVAVKRAKQHVHDMQLTEEFRSELNTLSNVEHLNLVKFIGYASDGVERILVFEYVPNGNLRQHLDGYFGKVLGLATRLDIAIDVAHAITYLHQYAEQSIIHRDIKSTNILLTHNFRAKVADFGFSRLGPGEVDATHVSTQVKGTAGYLDPEYIKTYQLTQKSDVYSFGVLLIEIFTGRTPIDQKRERNQRITARWVFEMFQQGKVIETLDPKLEQSEAASFVMEKVLELALQCVASTKQQRPSMRKAAEVLWHIRKELQKSRAHNTFSASCSSYSAASLSHSLASSDGRAFGTTRQRCSSDCSLSI